MSAKKKAEDLKSKTAIDEMRSFVAAGQAAQAAVEELEDPEQIFEQFSEELLKCCRKLKKHQLYFQEKKINPFTRLQEICQQNTLNFQDNFDEVAGMKAKE